MPDEASRFSSERRNDASYLSGRAEDSVLPAAFFRSRLQHLAGQDHFRRALEPANVERTAIEQLKMDCMQMNGVSVERRIHEFPNLDASVQGIFGDRIHEAPPIQQYAVRLSLHRHDFD